MGNVKSIILLAASIFACLAGILAFYLLFILDYNVYWLILSPVIIAIYESPAAFLFWLYKKSKEKKEDKKNAPDGI